MTMSHLSTGCGQGQGRARQRPLVLVALLVTGWVLAVAREGKAQTTPDLSPAGKTAEPAAAGADAKPAEAKANHTDIKIEFNDPNEIEPGKEEDDFLPYAPPIDQIFQNPALTANLAGSAEAINRSVESLMDSLFYSMLSNERNFYLGYNEIWLNAGLKRNFFSTPSGAYVVVDRFSFGPQYFKQLWSVQNIPVNLGADGTVEALQIYLRSDGMRLAEQEQLSTWRRWVNNWFGILPLLASVLPPSFNQNALYDPIAQVQTPFVFPLDVDGFNSMPVGSIRSYAISGGIRLTPDFGGMLDLPSQQQLQRIGNLQEGVPYSIFKRGEHRINVLRHDEHSAWVGVSDLNRVGHSISPLVYQNYYLLTGALAAKAWRYSWAWQGVPVSVLPINLDFQQAAVDLFDQVYEYDLRNPIAQEAYVAAVRGDFVTSRYRYLDAKEKGINTGVTFHFARQQDRTEEVSSNGPNVAVYKKERKRDHNAATIEITDQDGKFYVLESAVDVSDKKWDILVGEDETRMQQTVDMKVKRVVDHDDPNDPDKVTYVFEVDPSPYDLSLVLNIQDKWVDTTNYEQYVERVRYFTGLPLAELPQIARRDEEQIHQWRRSGYFSDPHEQASLIHVTPTYLGQFGAQAALYFTTEQIDRIIAAPEARVWAAFGKAFGQDEAEWADGEQRRSFSFQAQWYGALLLYPFRLINWRYPQGDAIAEADNAVKQLLALRAGKTPREKLDGFYRLLDTEYPLQLAHVLLSLADANAVPRRVVFSAQPKGSASQKVKTEYGRLNNMSFKAGPAFPPAGRYARAKAKLANFYLDQPRNAEDRPHLSKIQVTTRAIPESVRELSVSDEDGAQDGPEGRIRRDERHVFMTFSAKGFAGDKPLRLFVKIEEAGKLKIGKLALAEKVIPLTAIDTGIRSDQLHTYELFLTGPMSPLNNYMLNEATGSGDEFQVTLAVSVDGNIWSDQRTLEFRYERGRIYPLD